MSKPRNVRKAAQASLNERWIPLSKAESIGEMHTIWYNGKGCALCKLVDGLCRECPMQDKDLHGCHKNVCDFNYEREDIEGFAIAHKLALKVVKCLEKIAKG